MLVENRANLSVALRSSGSLEQALVAGQQAARHANRDWRIQHNLMTLALAISPPRPQLAVEAARLLVSLSRDTAPSTERLPFEALAQLADLPAAQHPRNLAQLFNDVCDVWTAEPAAYALRAVFRETAGDGLGAALDAGRAARLLRAVLTQDPSDAKRLERLVGAVRQHGRLLAAAPDDERLNDDRAAWRAGVDTLCAAYPSVAERLRV